MHDDLSLHRWQTAKQVARSIGVPLDPSHHTVMDAQHAEFFEKMAHIVHADPSELPTLLQDLWVLTHEHFKDEEMIMQTTGVAERDVVVHCQAHRRFEQYLQDAQTVCTHHTDLVQGAVGSFLAQWMSHHIRYTDGALAHVLEGPHLSNLTDIPEVPLDGTKLAALNQLWDTIGTQLFALIANTDRLTRLHAIYQALAGSVDVLLQMTMGANTWNQFCDTLTSGTPFHAVWLGQPGPDGVFEVLGRAGLAIAQIDEAPPVVTTENYAPLVVQVWRSGRMRWVNDTLAEPTLTPWHESFARNHWHSLLAAPIHRGGELWGVIAFASPIPQVFDAETVALCRRVSRLVSHSLDASDLRQSLQEQERELRFQVRTDPLTGLANRRALEDYLSADLKAGGRWAIAWCDIDRFKHLNDQWGHAVGDEILRVVAARLRGTLRQGDWACRVGGDEFVLGIHLATDSSWFDQLTGFTQRLEETMQHPLRVGSGPTGYRIHISLGLAVYPYHGRTKTALLRCADQAMYLAKHRRSDNPDWWEIADIPDPVDDV